MHRKFGLRHVIAQIVSLQLRNDLDNLASSVKIFTEIRGAVQLGHTEASADA
jgi:hypothetical protein